MHQAILVVSIDPLRYEDASPNWTEPLIARDQGTPLLYQVLT